MWLTLLALLGKIPATAISLFSGVNVSGIFTGIGNFFSGLIKNIETHWQLWLVGLLIAGNIFTAWEWNHTTTALTKEKAAHAADIATFKRTQAEADTRAQMIKQTLQKEAKANADQADASYSNLLAQYHGSLLRYASSKGSAKQPSNSQLSTTQGSNGPSTNTELPATLTISGDDAQICAVNTARLQSVHDWATSLPKDGGVIDGIKY